MIAKHHVTAHIEQGMLGTQLTLRFAEGVGAYGLKIALLGGNIFLRGIIPLILFVLFDANALEVFL